MSRLLLDIGNSRLKWALAEGERLLTWGVVEHRGQQLHSLLERELPLASDPGPVWISNVAGTAMQRALRRWARERQGRALRFVRSSAQAHGVINAYEEPEQLGSDRWLALLAARREHGRALCVFDSGSAITVDGLLADGRHVGGAIMPGHEAMVHALRVSTHLTALPVQAVATPWGTNTAACIDAGIRHAVLGLLRGFMERLAQQAGETPLCLVTGGGGQAWLPWLQEIPHRYCPDLVLQGLAIVSANDHETSLDDD